MTQLTTHCPKCKQDYTTRVPIRGHVDRTASVFYLYPFRCKLCNERFRAFKFGVKYIRREVERRQYQRINHNIPVEVRIGDVSHVAESIDLSLGGCRIQAPTSLIEGDIVTLGLKILEGEAPLKIEAAVVRFANKDEAGLEFIRIGDMERRLLRQYVQSLIDCFAPQEEQRLAG